MHLRELQGEDLSRYAFKAMTTWGNVNDFKHFLPRILELMRGDELNIHASTVLGKLKYGRWGSWESAEQKAVTAFLIAWWKHILAHHSCFDSSFFCGFYALTGTIEVLLQHWPVEIAGNTFVIYVDFIQFYYQDFIGRKNDFKDFDETVHTEFSGWIRKNTVFLEEGFYYFENNNGRFAAEISDALYTFEHS